MNNRLTSAAEIERDIIEKNKQLAKIREQENIKRIFSLVKDKKNNRTVDSWIRTYVPYESDLSGGRDAHYETNTKNRNATDENGHNLLDVAITHHNIEIIRLCIANDYRVDKTVAENAAQSTLSDDVKHDISKVLYRFSVENKSIKEVLDSLQYNHKDLSTLRNLVKLIPIFIEHDPTCLEKVSAGKIESIIYSGKAEIIHELVSSSIIDTNSTRINFWENVSMNKLLPQLATLFTNNPPTTWTEDDHFKLLHTMLEADYVKDEQAIIFIESIKKDIDWKAFHHFLSNHKLHINKRTQALLKDSPLFLYNNKIIFDNDFHTELLALTQTISKDGDTTKTILDTLKSDESEKFKQRVLYYLLPHCQDLESIILAATRHQRDYIDSLHLSNGNNCNKEATMAVIATLKIPSEYHASILKPLLKVPLDWIRILHETTDEQLEMIKTLKTKPQQRLSRTGSGLFDQASKAPTADATPTSSLTTTLTKK